MATIELAHFSDDENGVRSVITQTHDGRFCVRLHDTDADLYLPDMRIFNDPDAAKVYAESLIQ